jgi:hypothetical protein
MLASICLISGFRVFVAHPHHLHHSLPAAAGFFDPGDLGRLHLRRDHVRQLADILAHNPQITVTVGAIDTGIKFTAFAQGRTRHTRAAAPRGPVRPALRQWGRCPPLPPQPAGLPVLIPVIRSFPRICRRSVSATWRSEGRR